MIEICFSNFKIHLPLFILFAQMGSLLYRLGLFLPLSFTLPSHTHIFGICNGTYATRPPHLPAGAPASWLRVQHWKVLTKWSSSTCRAPALELQRKWGSAQAAVKNWLCECCSMRAVPWMLGPKMLQGACGCINAAVWERESWETTLLCEFCSISAAVWVLLLRCCISAAWVLLRECAAQVLKRESCGTNAAAVWELWNNAVVWVLQHKCGSVNAAAKYCVNSAAWMLWYSDLMNICSRVIRTRCKA